MYVGGVLMQAPPFRYHHTNTSTSTSRMDGRYGICHCHCQISTHVLRRHWSLFSLLRFCPPWLIGKVMMCEGGREGGREGGGKGSEDISIPSLASEANIAPLCSALLARRNATKALQCSG